MWKVLLVILFLAIIVAINYGVVESLWWWGFFQTTYNHSPGECRKLSGLDNGSEDIHLLPDGLAFISSGFRKGDNTEGKIFLFNMKLSRSQPEPEPEQLTIEAGANYSLEEPHGISAWTNANTNDVYLYVISHHPHESVDKFLFDRPSKKLTHKLRIDDEADFISLNDLAVVGEDQFFFTNTKKYCMEMELLFRLPLASVGFYNGSHAKLVEEDLFMPNGIAVHESQSGRFLYVAMFGGEEIRVYSIHDNNKLTFNSSIKVSTHVDNLFVHPQSGDIWFGATTVLYKLMEVAYDRNPTEKTSPSQVMRVKMSKGWQAGKVDEIYANDGSEISQSSVAVAYERNMLIGTMYTSAYFCKLPQDSQDL